MAKRATASATEKANTAKVTNLPQFANEAEEAEWWATPTGRRYSAQLYKKAQGVVEHERGFDGGAREILRSGKAVRFKNGMGIQRTDPEKLASLLASQKGPQTEAISLRLSISDLTAVRALAAKHGVKYQALLKQIIHDAVAQAG